MTPSQKRTKIFFIAGTVFLLLGVFSAVFLKPQRIILPENRNSQDGKKVIRGIGFVRGRGQVTLKNKYAGYVSKVNFYSQSRVKKGDVILEYDDLDLRTQIAALRHEIAEKELELEKKKLALSLMKIDPLSSDYRNLEWKYKAAQEKFQRHSHEKNVYSRLFRNRIVSELDYRKKKQETVDAEAELKRYKNDMTRIKQGIGKLNVEVAENEVKSCSLKLKNLKDRLALLEEQRKYYKIVAPFDGLCITNSDTVNGYNGAGTSAAVVHKDQHKIIWAYFDEREIGYIVEGKPCRFRSNQYDSEKEGFAVITPYEVKKDRNSWGDGCFFLVKFSVDKEVHPLRIDSTGQVEIDIE